MQDILMFPVIRQKLYLQLMRKLMNAFRGQSICILSFTVVYKTACSLRVI